MTARASREPLVRRALFVEQLSIGWMGRPDVDRRSRTNRRRSTHCRWRTGHVPRSRVYVRLLILTSREADLEKAEEHP